MLKCQNIKGVFKVFSYHIFWSLGSKVLGASIFALPIAGCCWLTSFKPMRVQGSTERGVLTTLLSGSAPLTHTHSLTHTQPVYYL